MRSKSAKIVLPRRLSTDNRQEFLTLLEQVNSVGPTFEALVIELDFSNLYFIEPDGLVALAAIIDWLKKRRANVKRIGGTDNDYVIRYLWSCGFFRSYFPNHPSAALARDTTFEFRRLEHRDSFSWINDQLMPWLATSFSRPASNLAEIKVCIQELFNNVRDHSTESVGCVVGQLT